MRGLWMAHDLARDLGFRGLTPAFWRWCKRHGLELVRPGDFRFRGEDVRRVLGRTV